MKTHGGAGACGRSGGFAGNHWGHQKKLNGICSVRDLSQDGRQPSEVETGPLMVPSGYLGRPQAAFFVSRDRCGE